MNYKPQLLPVLALNSPFIDFPMQLTAANDTVISLSGRLLQIEIRHQPQHIYQNQENKDMDKVRTFRLVTRPKAAKPKVERTKFIVIDESWGKIQHITLDPQRKIVCICASENQFPKFHMFSIASQQKVATFSVQENVHFATKVISVSISADQRWLVAQLSGNDFPLLAWSIPISIVDQVNSPAEKYVCFSTSKQTHLFKVQHEVNLIQFSISQPELILVSGISFYNIFMVSDSAIRLAAQITTKRLLNNFTQLCQTKDYTYVVVSDQCEILVLRGEVLTSFLFSEAIFNPKGQRINSTCRPLFKFPIIRNHNEFEGDKYIDEKISCINVINDKFLFVGSSRGRVTIYKIFKIDEKGMQQYPCRTTGGTNLSVVEVTLIMSMILPFDSPVNKIDIFNNLVLVSQSNNQCYISNQLTEDKLEKLITCQLGQASENVNIVLQSAFDSVIKLMRLIKDPQHIVLNSEELFLLNPLKQTSKINIQGAEDLERFEYLAFQDPNNWPYALFCPSLKCPLISTMQTISTVLKNVDQLVINNQIISPNEHFSGYQMGRQFFFANTQITAIASSDEANLLAIGDINGTVKIFDLTTMVPYCVWDWKMPDYVKFEENLAEDGEEDDDTKTHRTGFGGQINSNMQTTRTGITMTTNNQKYKTNTLDQTDENELNFSQRKYQVTSMKLHPSGLHIIIGGQGKDPQHVKFFNCLLICHVIHGDIEVSLILEFSSRINQIDFDAHGNFLFIMDQQSISVFSFYEMRLVTKLDFNLRLNFINDWFTPEMKHFMDEFNKTLNPQAVPLLFKVHESSGYVLVSFDDGDLVLFNCFCNRIILKFLVNGKTIIHRHIVDFEILLQSDYDQKQIDQYKKCNEGASIRFLPIIVLFSDSQVCTMNVTGHEIIICNKGLNNANNQISKIKLIHGFCQFSEWDKFKKTTSAMKDDSLINAMLLNAVKEQAPRQWLLCVGEKGILQLVPLPSIQKESVYLVQYHNSPINYLELIRDNQIVTVSQDQQVVFSNLKFGDICVSKPIPRAAIWASQTIRSRQLQEALDLLLFEILNKSFMMKQESEVNIKKLQVESEQQINKLFMDYQVLKNQVIRQLNDEQTSLTNAELDYQQKKQTQDQKAKVLTDELNHSYTEQLNILKQENEKLNKELIETKRQGERQVNDYNDETKRMVEDYQSKTNQKLSDMDNVIAGLVHDKDQLTQLSDAQIKKATEELEQEITILYKMANDAEKSESSTVVNLRDQHKQLEGQYMMLQKQFTDLKTQLNKQRNQIQFQQKELQYKKDQMSQIHNEIAEKENVEKMKMQTIRQMQDEKDDLLKLKQLLNQRVTDLKKQVAPRDDMIADLQTQVQDMDQELFKDALKQKNADMIIQDCKQKKHSLSISIQEKEHNIAETEQKMKEMLQDIQNFSYKYLQHIGIKPQNVQKQIDQIQVPISMDQAHREFATALKVIYSKHVDKDLAADLQGKLITNIQEQNTNSSEAQRIQNINSILGVTKIKLISKSSKETETPAIAKQREYLEKSVITLEKALTRRREQLNQAIEKARQQSSTLLGFSNQMRRENKTLQQRLRAAKLELIKKKQEMGILQEQLFGPALEALLEQDTDAPEGAEYQKTQNLDSSQQQMQSEMTTAGLGKYVEGDPAKQQEQLKLSAPPNLQQIPKDKK